MALSDILSAIATLLEGASGAGKVYANWRYFQNEKEIKDNCVASGIVNVAFVTREQTAAHDRGAGPSNARSRHKIVIEAFRAVASGAESEKAHQDLAEAFRDALHGSRRLPGGAGWLSTPVQVEQFGRVMFANSILCWHAKLSVIAEDVVQGG